MNERSKEMRARMAEVEKELARLRKQKKTLERDYPRDLPEDWADAPPPAPVPKAAPPPAGRGEAPLRAEPPATRADPLEREIVPGDGSRERFASYFMTGGLGHSGPQLRRERRAMRNKAIVAACVAAILLFALVRFLVR